MKNRQQRLWSPPIFDSNSSLRGVLLASLAKIQQPSTQQTGFGELKQLIPQLTSSQIAIFCNLLDGNEIQKSVKRDNIKVLSLLGELKGAELADHVPRIILMLNKRITEGDQGLGQAISDAYGSLNEHTIQTSDQKYDLLLNAIEQLHQNFSHNNKVAQQISAQSLCKLIQTTDIRTLESISKQYTNKTLEILKSPHCKTHQGLLESLLSLILSVEDIFQPQVDDTIQTVQLCFGSEEWGARKVAIDIIYSLCVIFPFIQQNEQLAQKVGDLRFDKIKHVRDAAQVAMTQLKDSRISQSKEHRSIFKMNANKDFFEKKADIQIVENKPKEEIKKLYDVAPGYEPPKPKRDYESPERLYKSFVQVNNNQNTPNQEKDRLTSFQSNETLQRLKTPPSPQIDIKKLYDSARSKQQAQNDRLSQFEQDIKNEISSINQRMGRLEQMLEKVIAKLDQQQQLQQQPQQQIQQQPQHQQQVHKEASEQQKIMIKIEDSLDKNNYNEAFSAALTSMDDQIIISTMMKTGPCTERLDSTQVEFLLHKLRTLDWIENALQHHLAKMPTILLKSISNSIKQLPQSDQVQRIQNMLN